MISTADLLDAHPDDALVCRLAFRQFGGVPEFSGQIATIRCFEDNVVLKARVAEPGEGRVLVVDGGGSLRIALLGDMVAGLAAASGWAGLVVNGCVRDVAVLRHLPIGIKALGANPRPSGKAGAGEIDVPVAFGGITFSPGATLTSDDDGIVVLETVG
jgi:regulator of ribonuclease activity A